MRPGAASRAPDRAPNVVPMVVTTLWVTRLKPSHLPEEPNEEGESNAEGDWKPSKGEWMRNAEGVWHLHRVPQRDSPLSRWDLRYLNPPEPK